MLFSLLFSASLLSFTIGQSTIQNSIYVIRSAEMPSLGISGFTPIGSERAENCIPEVFGSTSSYDIGYIMTCNPTNSTACLRAKATVTPLSHAISIDIDDICWREDDYDDENDEDAMEDCIYNRIVEFAAGSGRSILIVWPGDEESMDDLFGQFDDLDDVPDFPEASADVIYTIRNNEFIGQTSQNCPGLDGTIGLPMMGGGESPLPRKRAHGHARRSFAYKSRMLH